MWEESVWDFFVLFSEVDGVLSVFMCIGGEREHDYEGVIMDENAIS